MPDEPEVGAETSLHLTFGCHGWAERAVMNSELKLAPQRKKQIENAALDLRSRYSAEGAPVLSQ